MGKQIFLSEFSRTPGTGKRCESEFSGEQYFDEVLFKEVSEAIKSKQVLAINFDGTAGVHNSFFEMICQKLMQNFKLNDIWDNITFISCENPEYIFEIYFNLRQYYEAENK